MKATLKHYKQTPRKTRLVADMVRGEKVEIALEKLSFINKKAAQALKKLIQSAQANAWENDGIDKRETLYVSNLTVDEGPVMKRYRPGARGRAYPYKRRTSHVRVELTTDQPKK